MVTFSEKSPGITVATVTNDSACAQISLYGGHVLSYIPAKKRELLFVSSKSIFEIGKPIRGGIPICFPWFGPSAEDPTAPPHGFARTSQWSLVSIEDTKKETRIILELTSSEITKKVWNYDFKLSIEIVVGNTLDMTLITANTGSKNFNVTTALHTYYAISDIRNLSIQGLKDVSYIDRVGEKTTRTQSGDVVISSETDRVYNSTNTVKLIDSANKGKIVIRKTANPDTVVWNPWIERTKAIGDLADEEYASFICVESGSVLDNTISIEPETSVAQSMTIELK